MDEKTLSRSVRCGYKTRAARGEGLGFHIGDVDVLGEGPSRVDCVGITAVVVVDIVVGGVLWG